VRGDAAAGGNSVGRASGAEAASRKQCAGESKAEHLTYSSGPRQIASRDSHRCVLAAASMQWRRSRQSTALQRSTNLPCHAFKSGRTSGTLCLTKPGCAAQAKLNALTGFNRGDVNADHQRTLEYNHRGKERTVFQAEVQLYRQQILRDDARKYARITTQTKRNAMH